eukprot:TRINITY_DN59213_c0_g1_i3.p1 TRINITY_DN59213_c0_g1~~TRINITY_DN59213_c0_g1_i3.p1  ORF type:complete len:274 (-),score=50.14 TRINITY_DN59213_c0_g1_i3:31-852(-)
MEQMASVGASEDALRKAYDERMVKIGRKLQFGESSPNKGHKGGSRLAAKRSPAALAYDANGGGYPEAPDAVEAVDMLVQRVRTLCQQRRSTRKEMQQADQRHGAVVRDLRSELAEAQTQNAEMLNEQARLQQLLAECAQEAQPERQEEVRNKTEKLQKLRLEADALDAAYKLTATHLSALQLEAQESRERANQLLMDHTAVHEGVCVCVVLHLSTDDECSTTSCLHLHVFDDWCRSCILWGRAPVEPQQSLSLAAVEEHPHTCLRPRNAHIVS